MHLVSQQRRKNRKDDNGFKIMNSSLCPLKSLLINSRVSKNDNICDCDLRTQSKEDLSETNLQCNPSC